MKEKTKVWVELAKRHFTAAKLLADEDYVINVALFHCQQTVEKLLKALLEEFDFKVPRVHTVVELYDRLPDYVRKKVIIDIIKLQSIDDIYIETRYPSDIGLLPSGFPTKNDFIRYFEIAKDIFNKIILFLENTI